MLSAHELQTKWSRKGREQDTQSAPQIATCREKPMQAATNHCPQETPVASSKEEGAGMNIKKGFYFTSYDLGETAIRHPAVEIGARLPR
eukprot:4618070-Ditylum_brightwellii.AAC.1